MFSLVMAKENKTFPEALEYLADRAGIQRPDWSPEDREAYLRKKKEQEEDENLLSCLADACHEKLKGSSVIPYLEGRGIGEEVVRRYRLGFVDATPEKIRSYLLKESFSKEVIDRSQVLKDSRFWQNSLIISIIQRGKIVTLCSRTLADRESKYLYLSGHLKGLFNFDEAACHDEIIITEATIDALTLNSQEFNNAVSIGGCNASEGQIEALKRLDKKCLICLDNDADKEDNPGQKASLKLAKELPNSKIVTLPSEDGEKVDVNSYFASGGTKEGFGKLISEAKTLIEFMIFQIPSTDKPYPGLSERVKPIIDKIAIQDFIEQEASINLLKDRFGLAKEAIRKMLGGIDIRGEVNIKEERKKVYTALFDGLIDLVEYEDRPAFLIKENDELKILFEVARDDVLYLPPPKEDIPWLLPRGEAVIEQYKLLELLPKEDRDRILYDDLFSYHRNISELPKGEYYDLLVCWDFHTYLLDSSDIQYSPILYLFAVPERGKSRTGKGAIYVAYRGIHVESLREAYLIRLANNYRATIFFDVMNIWKKAEKNNSEDILLHRYEKGAKVPRVLYPEKGAHKDTVYYDVFGATIIGTNVGVHKILETRAVPCNMPEGRKKFENDVRPELSLPLKERLVAFRASHLGEKLPDIFKPASGRLGDILKPLCQVIHLVKPEKKLSFLEFIKELEADRMIEKSDTLEAHIMRITLELGGQVEKGILPVKTITNTLNDGKPESRQFSYQRIGRILSAMGFKKGKASDGASAVIWEEEKISLLKQSYGLREMSVMSESSVSSETPPIE